MEKESDQQTFLRTKYALEEQLKAFQEKIPQCNNIINSTRNVLSRFDKYGSLAVTLVPEPYSIAVAEKKNGKKTMIFVRYLERKSDILGVRVREFWPDGQTVSEIYELDKYSRRLLSPKQKKPQWSWYRAFALDISERKDPNMHKNEREWRAWVEGDIKKQPPMYIAKPGPKTHVLISLVDEKGHESKALELNCWVTYTSETNSERAL